MKVRMSCRYKTSYISNIQGKCVCKRTCTNGIEQIELINPTTGQVVTVPFADVVRYLCSSTVEIIRTPVCSGAVCPLLVDAENVPDGIVITVNPVFLTPSCQYVEAASFARLGTVNPYVVNNNVLNSSNTYDIMIFGGLEQELIRMISNVREGERVLIPELQGGEKRIAYLYVTEPSEALSIFFD